MLIEFYGKECGHCKSRGICMGVPFFVNTKTQKTICGEATYDELKNWASGF